jgi:hypothetical protein
MRNFLIVAGICLGAYEVDALWFDGVYLDAFMRMVSDIARHFR